MSKAEEVMNGVQVDRFIEDWCVTGPAAGSVLLRDLYAAFVEYVAGDYPAYPSRGMFRQHLLKRGYRAWFDGRGFTYTRLSRIALLPVASRVGGVGSDGDAAGAAPDPAHQSADGDPAGYGDPVPAVDGGGVTSGIGIGMGMGTGMGGGTVPSSNESNVDDTNASQTSQFDNVNRTPTEGAPEDVYPTFFGSNFDATDVEDDATSMGGVSESDRRGGSADQPGASPSASLLNDRDGHEYSIADATIRTVPSTMLVLAAQTIELLLHDSNDAKTRLTASRVRTLLLQAAKGQA